MIVADSHNQKRPQWRPFLIGSDSHLHGIAFFIMITDVQTLLFLLLVNTQTACKRGHELEQYNRQNGGVYAGGDNSGNLYSDLRADGCSLCQAVAGKDAEIC